MLKVNEIFTSISGEVGRFRQGEFAIFLRLAGCNLRCKWCDTAYAQTTQGSEEIKVEDLVHKLNSMKLRNLIITGGEPLCQQEGLKKLVDALFFAKQRWNVQIETNGSLMPPDFLECSSFCFVYDYKLPSSGMESEMLHDGFFYSRSYKDWVKFVVDDENDYEQAKNKAYTWSLVNPFLHIAFSPTPNLSPKKLVEWMMRDCLTKVVVSLQIHKIGGLK